MNNDLLNKPIEAIPVRTDIRGLRVKILGAFEALGAKTIRDVINIVPEQLVCRSAFGAKSLAEIRRALAEIGLSLRNDDGASRDVIFAYWDRAGRPRNEGNAQPDLRKFTEMLRQLTDDERREIFSNFCAHCGSKDPGCQCWNDE